MAIRYNSVLALAFWAEWRGCKPDDKLAQRDVGVVGRALRQRPVRLLQGNRSLNNNADAAISLVKMVLWSEFHIKFHSGNALLVCPIPREEGTTSATPATRLALARNCSSYENTFQSKRPSSMKITTQML